MVIQNKKSKAQQEISQEGWDKLVRAGWKDKYTIIDGAPGPSARKGPTPAPPEIASFAKPIGKLQAQPATDQEQQQPTGKQAVKKQGS